MLQLFYHIFNLPYLTISRAGVSGNKNNMNMGVLEGFAMWSGNIVERLLISKRKKRKQEITFTFSSTYFEVLVSS